MRAARLHAMRDVRVADEPDPIPRDGESLVRVGAVGLCGSDLHWYAEGGIGGTRIDVPRIMGHEMGGVAVTGPYAGRTVAIDPALPCHHCERCLEGNTNLCPDIQFSGQGATEGSRTELLVWPDTALFPLPDSMNVEDAAMLEPLGVAIHAWDLSHVKLGDRVAIVGAGPIGLFLVQLAKGSLTNRIGVVEPLAHRREVALQLGADEAVDPSGLDSLGQFDVVFEVSGLPAAVTESVTIVRNGGRVVLVGIPEDDATAFPAGVIRRKGLTISVVRRMKEVYPRAIALVERGQVDTRAIVSHRYNLEDITDGLEFANSRQGLKVVIRPDGQV